MNQLEGLIILLALPAGILLTGYWLPAMLRHATPLERLALALPAGLSAILALVATINFFRPLAGLWAYACLSPAVITLAVPAVRQTLRDDVLLVWRQRQNSILAASGFFFICLLWPVLQNPSALLYDGTSNHDSFFWISSAEHLKRNTYMQLPLLSATQPLTNSATAIIGWTPPWGRMGSEGLLAMVSSVIGVSPLKLFLYGAASLQFTWVALAWLALRTFYGPLSARAIGAALVCLQPVFVFSFGNSNLPNLLGALTGATLVISVQRALAAGRQRDAATPFLLLITLAMHGLLCTYPEMIPFVLLSAGLLWLRAWFSVGWHAARLPCLSVAGAIIFGLLLNSATTARAFHGFVSSFTAARADAQWANRFASLIAAEYLPALSTLSFSATRILGPWLGWPLSLAIATSVVFMFRFSRDRFGLAAVFAGTFLLIGYTVTQDFSYGWQKSVQFAGVFFGMAFPAAALDSLNRARTMGPALWRRLCAIGLAGLALFLGFATVMEFREGYKWSDRKVISSDWFKLRDHAGKNLRGATVLVESASFRMAFFHGMWAAYFLRDSHIYYAARGEESGGYLRYYVRTEQDPAMPAPDAYLVGREWADTFDANSPRILTGREFTLLQKSNRVFTMAGVTPLNGLPDYASGAVQLDIQPHTPGNLLVELEPREIEQVPSAEWHLARTAEGSKEFTATLAGPPPWRLKVPLVASQRNRITITLSGAKEPSGVFRFIVRSLRIEDSP